MRWFKHMTSAADDEKLSRLKDEFGLEGYGFWWSVVEIVAGKVGLEARASVGFSPKKWGNALGISPKKFRSLAEFCAGLGLFSAAFSPELIQIDMPNILKYRDEYTERQGRKSGRERDNLPASRARDPESEAEVQTEAQAEREPEREGEIQGGALAAANGGTADVGKAGGGATNGGAANGGTTSSGMPNGGTTSSGMPNDARPTFARKAVVSSPEPVKPASGAAFPPPGSGSLLPVLVLPLNDGSGHPVGAGDIEQWQDLYPAVDVGQALRNMRGWLLGNPRKRKTRHGIGRFIHIWLAKEQDKGGRDDRCGREGVSSTREKAVVKSYRQREEDSVWDCFDKRLAEERKASGAERA